MRELSFAFGLSNYELQPSILLHIGLLEMNQPSMIEVEHSKHEGCGNCFLSDRGSYTTEPMIKKHLEGIQVVEAFMI